MAQTGTIEAIVTLFQATTALTTAFAEGLWIDGVPEQQEDSLPLVVLRDGGATYDYNTEDSYVENRTVSFSVYAKGAASAETLAAAIKLTFDKLEGASVPSMTGGAQWLSMFREREQIGADKPAKDGSPVYGLTMEYAIAINRPYLT